MILLVGLHEIRMLSRYPCRNGCKKTEGADSGRAGFGASPPAFPFFPQTYGYAILAITLVTLSSGDMVICPAFASYLLTTTYGMRKEVIDAPVALLFTVTPMLGGSLGPMALGPFVDAYGVANVASSLAGFPFLATCLTVTVLWPTRRVDKLQTGEAEASTETATAGDETDVPESS